MEKIFYTDKSNYLSSEEAVRYVFSEFFGIEKPKIVRNENGKPFLKGCEERIFFSVSHTDKRLFIAVADENVGLDAEALSRSVDYLPILRRFPAEERVEIRSKEDFLRHWTAKESAVKWMGGTLANDLGKIGFIKDRLFYGAIEFPVFLVFFERDGHLLAVCSERNFEGAEFIPI